MPQKRRDEDAEWAGKGFSVRNEESAPEPKPEPDDDPEAWVWK